MTESPWIQDVTSADFPEQAIERSKQVPVLVDFWATWCGPCKTLGPALEKLATELDGRFVLVKVDVDQNPDLGQIFQIQSIPTVLLLKDGKVVDGFMGALPEVELRKFIDQHAPPTVKPGEAELESARAVLAEGDTAEATKQLEALLEAQPELDEARLLLVGCLIELGRLPEAQAAFAQLSEEGRAHPDAGSLEARLQLVEDAGDVVALEQELKAAPDDLGARIRLGKALAGHGRTEEGLEHLLEAIRTDLHFDDDAARKAMLEIFEALGAEDPLALEFRRRLQVVLY